EPRQGTVILSMVRLDAMGRASACQAGSVLYLGRLEHHLRDPNAKQTGRRLLGCRHTGRDRSSPGGIHWLAAVRLPLPAGLRAVRFPFDMGRHGTAADV